MQITEIITDETLREIREHGTPEFPFEYYLDDIDKIMAKSRRKNMFSMEMTDLEMMAPSGSPELRPYQGLKGTDYSSGMPGADTYELIVVNNGEKKKIIFEPNKTVCEGLKMLAPRKVFCK